MMKKQPQMDYYIEVVESAKKYIERNIEQGVSPDDTAKAANYSLKQLNRIFFMVTGLTIGEYIRWNKLTKALFELENNDASIISIGLKYGYDSQEAFTRAFKDSFSVTPGEYKKAKEQQQEVTLKLKIKPEMIDRIYEKFDESIVEKQPDGSLIVSINIMAENNWLYGTILSYGEYVEILEPESIRKMIKDKVLKISKIYS